MGYFTTYLPYIVPYFPMMFPYLWGFSLIFHVWCWVSWFVASQAIDFTLPEESYLSRIEVGNSEDISDIPICTFTHINIYIYYVCSYIISKNLTLFLYLYIIRFGKFHRYERELYFGMCSLSLSTICLFNVLRIVG